MSHLDMFADPEPPPERDVVSAWLKTPRTLRGAAPLPTLIWIPGDDHEYSPARFTLAAGCTFGKWPSKDACVLGPDGVRMTLYDAVGARLAAIAP